MQAILGTYTYTRRDLTASCFLAGLNTEIKTGAAADPRATLRRQPAVDRERANQAQLRKRLEHTEVGSRDRSRWSQTKRPGESLEVARQGSMMEPLGCLGRA
ncbi:hypothetical protein MAPG_02786 [Magnaporthiopsis poae ATCC 64411]|uniref:Uncharacterized protein n=1 Tax=Magnaporthiopsis poae (strain ATCC 64411 / 73-15) TaxID=644358 RepID=A0A0C4DSA8_MAGP6|nr:hypothetical protein MAPG_02786 [Magnaporthiopsis poae ATCC 64411]